jgi:3-dehydroquinate synthase
VLLITNDRISPLYLDKYEKLLKLGGKLKVETLVLPDGEENKSMEVLSLILDKALECSLDRKATFVALGGGVIGDMVGFAAAIYQRGVNFVQVSIGSHVYQNYQPFLKLTINLYWWGTDRSLRQSWPW